MSKHPVRVSAKAVIIENNRLLCNKHETGTSIYYTLPGGGQEYGETIFQALIRECYEEIGAYVVPERIVFVRDYIRKNHEFAVTDDTFHQIEIIIQAQLAIGSQPALGEHPDGNQTGVEWIALNHLDQFLFYPQALIPELMTFDPAKNGCRYLGDVN